MLWIVCALVLVVAVVVLRARFFARVSRPSEPIHCVTVPVFAEGDLARLPLSLSIETFGGVSMMLIFRDTTLPVVRRELFSTAADNQTSVEVHVLVGDRTLAADNVTIGTFEIVQIPTAPGGVPTYEVELRIGRDGVFRFSARDKRTGQPQPVSASTVLPGPLSASTVARMLDEAKAEEARGEYGVPRTTPDELDSVTILTRQLRDLLQTTRHALQSATSLPGSDREACEKQLDAAEQLLKNQARPERASIKLNTLKGDELEAAIAALSSAAKRCQ